VGSSPARAQRSFFARPLRLDSRYGFARQAAHMMAASASSPGSIGSAQRAQRSRPAHCSAPSTPSHTLASASRSRAGSPISMRLVGDAGGVTLPCNRRESRKWAGFTCGGAQARRTRPPTAPGSERVAWLPRIRIFTTRERSKLTELMPKAFTLPLLQPLPAWCRSQQIRSAVFAGQPRRRRERASAMPISMCIAEEGAGFVRA
jgi:hypothetical protein